MKTTGRRILPHRRPEAAQLAAAHRVLREIGDKLEMIIVVRSIDGVGPVRIEGAFIYGRVAMDVVAEGPTESAALRELARKAIAFRGADQQWFLRYGLGSG